MGWETVFSHEFISITLITHFVSFQFNLLFFFALSISSFGHHRHVPSIDLWMSDARIGRAWIELESIFHDFSNGFWWFVEAFDVFLIKSIFKRRKFLHRIRLQLYSIYGRMNSPIFATHTIAPDIFFSFLFTDGRYSRLALVSAWFALYIFHLSISFYELHTMKCHSSVLFNNILWLRVCLCVRVSFSLPHSHFSAHMKRIQFALAQ